jgi:NAD(P)-dependent dehydrogenase (short-subunit alcohol dehydrogenase family)
MEGKVALVTGGGSGIGRATCLRFAEEGAAVAVADQNEAGGAETVEKVEALGRKAAFFKLEVTNEENVEQVVADAVQQLGRIDALMAAAGIFYGTKGRSGMSGILDMPNERWQHTLDVNLNGVMYCDRAVARHMIQRGGGGTIVNVASGAAKIPTNGNGEYSVSKAGVWMLTKTLALELAPQQIRVNAIAPGLIDTPMTASIMERESAVEAFMRGTPLGRVGQPLDIANTALFLSCDESSYYTGQMLEPVGGAFTG